MKYSLIMTTCENTKDAKLIADVLLQERLAACVQAQEIVSHYIWEGSVKQGSEVLLYIKTKASCYAKVEEAILKEHKYQTPEIIEVPIDKGLRSYFNWIDESVQ